MKLTKSFKKKNITFDNSFNRRNLSNNIISLNTKWIVEIHVSFLQVDDGMQLESTDGSQKDTKDLKKNK